MKIYTWNIKNEIKINLIYSLIIQLNNTKVNNHFNTFSNCFY